MKLSKTIRKYIHGALIASFVLILFSALFSINAFKTLEWKSEDAITKVLRAGTKANEDVIILLVDETSLQVMDSVVGRWPWPRSVWADVLDFMVAGGASSVAFDILFTERALNAQGEQSEHDLAFMDATAESGIAVQAVQLLHDEHNPYPFEPLPLVFKNTFAMKHIQGVPLSLNNTKYIPFEGLYNNADKVGVVEFSPDSDGLYRRTNLFRDYLGSFFPVLSAAPLIKKLGITQVRQTEDNRTIYLNDMKVPLDREGHYQVNFYEEFETFSMGSILASSLELKRGNIEALYTDPRYVSPDLFEDKIVFIGTSAVGLEDMKNTPLSNRWPGVFLHASIASNMLEQDFTTQIDAKWVYLIFALTIFLVTALVLISNNLLTQFLFPATVAIIYTSLALYVRYQYQFQVDIVSPVAAMATVWLLLSAYLASTEGAEKKRVRNMLSQYVSPAAMSSVLDNYENLAMAGGGTEEEMTVVFSDIRGFTTISEKLKAADVVTLLNIHLEAMTQATFDHGGTMDKFIGDATMAFWGAPLPDKEHALHATRTMMAMMKAMEQVNHDLADLNIDPITIGVGANTGRVILGNIGSSQKLDYTIIGDAVNLGARLEGLTKQYGLDILLSEFTYSAIKHAIPCALIDQVRVKGKNEPIKIYTPLADIDSPNFEEAKTLSDHCELAFTLYENQLFEQSLELINILPDERFAFYKNMHTERCQAYIKNPPPKDWDGVFNLTTK